MVDGPRARPAAGAVRARAALDVLQGAAPRPAPVWGMRRASSTSPCRPREHFGTAHTEPPEGGPGRCWGFVQLRVPQRGPGVVGWEGAVWEGGVVGGGCCKALFADSPGAVLAGPPTCAFHPTFLSRSAPASDLAVIEVGEQCVLFFVGSVHQVEVWKGDNVDAESEIHFAMSCDAPPGRPTTLWHLMNTAPAWRSPICSKAGAWSITCPCNCKVCLLVCLICLLANSTKFT